MLSEGARDIAMGSKKEKKIMQSKEDGKRDKGKQTNFLIKCECSEPKMIQQHNPCIRTTETLRVSIISLVISGWRS